MIYIGVTGTANITRVLLPTFIIEVNAKCHLKCNELVKIKM